MLNGINEEGLSDDRYKIKVKNHPGATTEDICDLIKLEVRKKKPRYNHSSCRNQ